MVPSARKYGPVVPLRMAKPPFAPSVAPSTSTSSLSLEDMLAVMEPPGCHFLDSLSDISSICSDTFDSKPSPFPVCPNHSLLHFADLRSSLLHCPKDDSRDSMGAPVKYSISAPTAPRLRAILGEVINVSRWKREISIPSKSHHTPWTASEHCNEIPDIFEGSLFTRADFKSMLARSHRLSSTSISLDWSFETNDSVHPPDIFALDDEDASIFEHEITVQDNGRVRRLSVQVKMNPETVDTLVQLRRLSSYFADTDRLDEAKEDAAAIQSPPALIVSSFTDSSLFSFDSAASQASDNLTAATSTAQPPGTPADSTQCDGRESMNLTEMMASLRSRCASFGSDISAATSADDEAARVSMASFTNCDDDDEWAFADTLLNVYGESSIISGHSETFLEGDDTLDASAISPNQDLESPGTLKVHGKSSQYFSHEIAYDKLSPPPSSPLPSIPVLSPPSPKQVQHVRGILKTCKSVRFVSLPGSESCESSDGQSLHEPSPIPPGPVISPSAAIRKASAEYRDRAKIAQIGSASISPQKCPTSRRASESAAVRSTARRPSVLPTESKIANLSGKHHLAVGRHSIGAKSTKENRVRSSSLPSAGEVRDSGLKSRMPVAVRNVLARFK
ncbi:hypothetical protein HWV62_30206 [Athelia sp. TMB]|nr:hypothetical protein HWV62_30206 [Athelia sp. TMB]